MDAQKIINELKKKYPGKNIVVNTPENPTEVICEIEPGSMDPEKSVSIAVMDKNLVHYHRMAKETYEVMEGILEVNKEGKTHILQAGQKITINPEEYHSAEGHETWVRVTSTPAWTPEDHILVPEEGHLSK